VTAGQSLYNPVSWLDFTFLLRAVCVFFTIIETDLLLRRTVHLKKEILLTAVEAVPAAIFQALLDEFEQAHNVHVQLQVVPWEHYRTEFVNIALKRQAGDVGLVGAPLTSDLIGMNALRPFSAGDVANLGGASAFLPARWQNGIRPGESQVWAVPWALDVRVLYYWRDLLAQAGVDEVTAFTSPAALAQACQQLSASGMPRPLGLSEERYSILHSVASFIWACGGDLFSPDGSQVIFHEAPGLAGMRAYFDLVPYVPPGVVFWNNRARFNAREVAITVGNGLAEDQVLPGEMGCAPLPGASYVGGADMIVWGHARGEMAALELVRFLSQSGIQRRVSAASPLLPVRLSGLEELAGHPSPVVQGMARAALNGRSFPCVPMIGLLEDRLSLTLSQINQELQSDPSLSVETLLQTRVVPLGRRTNISLSSR
jgi:multiple sugar transport system substrate-binding protein